MDVSTKREKLKKINQDMKMVLSSSLVMMVLPGQSICLMIYVLGHMASEN